ncbi:MAG: alpha/beta hydrolase [Bdellovibrionaceae bacterium]|nr:alpha/beta hydrolase [Pseudobdellovibrionaceae bacterium]NUM58301.1 alpha/beta hydrolase [Pseudobdellovibrionaceae bacterium]
MVVKNKRQWLLLRGLTRGKFHWCDFPKELAKYFPDDEVTLIDLPGNGSRNQELSPLHINEYVTDLRDKIEKKGSLHLIAFSFGAMVAIEWLNQYPEEIEKTYLINTSIKGLKPFYKRLLPENYLEIFGVLFKSNLEREKIILKMTSNNLEVSEKVLLQFEKIAERHPIKLENLLRQLMAASSMVFPKNIQSHKVNIFVSANDRLVSSENSMEIAKRWGLAPMIHPWAGHDMVLDDPNFLLERLNWLNS